MQASESVSVDNRRVIVRTGDATVTVYLTGRGTGKERNLVTVNRDVGGPTETIPRDPPTRGDH